MTFEEGTWSAWLYDLLNPHVDKLVVCNPRKNALLKDGNQSDRIDARKLAELLRGNLLIESFASPPYAGVPDLGQPLSSIPRVINVSSRTGNRPAAVDRFQPIHDPRQVFDDGQITPR